jgi:regulator of sigma E protease
MSVNGTSIESFDEIHSFVLDRPGEPMDVRVRRGGQIISLSVTPRLTWENFPGGRQQVGFLGITGPTSLKDWKHVTYGPVAATGEACNQTWTIVATTFDQLWRIVTGKAKANQLSGPIGITKLAGDVAAVSYLSLFRLAALISISIGMVNLFPIPILDGGHLLYYGFEAVLGRPLGAKAQDLGFRLGLAVMVCLMLLAAWNDLVRLNLF